MAIESDLVTYVAAQGALALTSGTNLFEGPMPESPDACVALTHYASENSDEYVMGASLTAPGIEIVRVQLAVRHSVKATGETLAAAVHRFLDNLQDFTGASGKKIFAIESDGPPYSLGQDLNERWSWVANYRIQMQPV